jgi:tRNA threonylcarbamoyladenosine biosynthesis protein TsaB
MILFIDSSGYDQLHLAVIDSEKSSVKEKKIKITYPETEKTLGYLDQFLKSNKFKLDNVKKIIVVSGPGSFTGIRVGVSMSLAFSFAKDIPLYSITKDKVPKKLKDIGDLKLKKVKSEFDPEYGAEPNITIKK